MKMRLMCYRGINKYTIYNIRIWCKPFRYDRMAATDYLKWNSYIYYWITCSRTVKQTSCRFTENFQKLQKELPRTSKFRCHYSTSFYSKIWEQGNNKYWIMITLLESCVLVVPLLECSPILSGLMRYRKKKTDGRCTDYHQKKSRFYGSQTYYY